MKKYCMKCMRPIENGDICPVCGEIHPQRIQPMMLQPGTILKERYLIGNALGQGGFGITYIGYDTLLNMRVAVKEYFPTGYATRNIYTSTEIIVSNPQNNTFIKDGIEKFLAEARALAEFHDENGVVDVRDFFRDNNTAYIVMEYLDGATLQQCIKQKKFTPELIFELITPVIDSLEKIHKRNIIHRDISPDNIMMLNDGKLKLMDFGAARQVDFSNQKSMSVVLKTGYAPAEQYRPKGELGPWTDIYALCATIYVCITGVHPDNALERMFNDEIKWPRDLGIPISDEHQDILKKGMAVNAKDRFQSIDELRRAIAGAKDAVVIPPETNEDISKESYLDKNDGADVLSELVSEIVLENAKKENDEYDESLNPSAGASSEMAMTVAVIEDSTPKKAEEPKQKMTEPSEPKHQKPKQKDNKENKAVSKESDKNKKYVIAGIAAIVIIAIIIIGVKLGTKDSPKVKTPTHMTMMTDAGTVLQNAGLPGMIEELNIESDNYSEKYGTYLALCKVNVSGAGEKTVKLMYTLKDDTWKLTIDNCSVN